MRVGDSIVLENHFLPLLEVNALYSDSAFEHPISIRQSRLEPMRLEGDNLAGTLVALKLEPLTLTSSIWVEQVAWTQASLLARVWCDENDASDWQAFTARELARILETHLDLLAYIAYVADDAVGMMIASDDGFCGLWAGKNDVALALFARGANDLGKLEVSVSLERRDALKIGRETARFEIFISGNWDHQSLEASP